MCDIYSSLLSFVDLFYRFSGFDISSVYTVILNDGTVRFDANGCLFNNSFLDIIHICVDSSSYYCQIMYQLVHERCHQLMYRIFNGYFDVRNVWISWIEELVCEVCSICFFDCMSKYWDNCSLSSISPNYGSLMYDYFCDIKRDKSSGDNLGGILLNCDSYVKFLSINGVFDSSSERSKHFVEVLDLVNMFDFDFLYGLFLYRYFADFDKCLIDTYNYRIRFSDNPMVCYLCDLQDNIQKRATDWI